MLKRRRNAGLRLNSAGERGSTVNNSASISSNNASARREKTPSSLWRKVCRSCKGAGVVIPPNHRQISNLVKPSGEWALNFSTDICGGNPSPTQHRVSDCLGIAVRDAVGRGAARSVGIGQAGVQAFVPSGVAGLHPQPSRILCVLHLLHVLGQSLEVNLGYSI